MCTSLCLCVSAVFKDLYELYPYFCNQSIPVGVLCACADGTYLLTQRFLNFAHAHFERSKLIRIEFHPYVGLRMRLTGWGHHDQAIVFCVPL